jgi:hypothetical protein
VLLQEGDREYGDFMNHKQVVVHCCVNTSSEVLALVEDEKIPIFQADISNYVLFFA